MFNLALAKRIAVILLAAILISSFVACGKKDVDVIVSSSNSSDTNSVNSKVEIKEDDNDDAASMTSSELEDLEEGTFGGETSSFTPLPQASQPENSGNTNSSESSNTSSKNGNSSDDASSEPGYISNGPGVFVPSLNSSTPSSSTQDTSTPSSSTQDTSTPSSSTQDTSTPSSSEENTSSESIKLPGYLPDWF